MKKSLLFLLIIIFCNIAEANWFGKDKVMHLTASSAFTYWSYGINKNVLQKNSDESAVWAAAFSLNIGLFKEYSDKYFKKTKWSWQDLVYDIAGVGITFVLINNVDFLEKK
ncbi:MAG: hypothetical protein SVM86_07130 [Candidatus Cloacimonadota bacterium]|nr:hypothetical protein [Candidatus Cloacimonadota bacterium]